MSSSPDEIERGAKIVYDLTEDTRRGSKEVTKEIIQVNNFWEGTASRAFRTDEEQLTASMSALIKHMEQAERDLRKLANEVRRADAERAEKRRLEEQMKAAQQNNKH